MVGKGTTVGFIGLGAMGKPMASRLMDAGYPLVVYNRDKSAAEPFVKRGATVAASPSEVVEKSDVTFSMVTDDAAVCDVFFGTNGVFSGLTPGKIYADMTTASPGIALELEAAAATVGAATLDVRVSGSVEPAERGELLVLVGGDRKVADDLQPILEIFGKKVLYTGDHGTAATVKLSINILLGLEMEALAEAFVLAEKAGIDPDVAVEAIGSSAVASPVIQGKLAQIQDKNYERGFALRLMQKDYRLVLEEGDRLSTPLPTTSTANEVAITGLANGYSELDMVALYLTVANLAGEKKVAITRKVWNLPAKAPKTAAHV